jgi:hypothetical protein
MQVERDARAMVEADPAHRQYLERILVFLYHHVLKNKGECRSADNIEIGLEQAPFVFFNLFFSAFEHVKSLTGKQDTSLSVSSGILVYIYM